MRRESKYELNLLEACIPQTPSILYIVCESGHQAIIKRESSSDKRENDNNVMSINTNQTTDS